MLLLVVLLLPACSSAPPAAPSAPPTDPAPTARPIDSPGTSPTAPASPMPPPAASDPAGAEWRVLADELALPEAPFAVRAAVGPNAYAELWSELGQDGPPPEVQFERQIVIFLGMSGSSSCPEVLEGLVVDHQDARVYGEWRMQQGRPCTDDLGPQGVLLAVSRAALPQQTFLLSLRQTLICPDCLDQPDRIFVDPTAGEDA